MEELLQRVEALGTYLDIDGRKERLAELQQQRLDPSFWDDPDTATSGSMRLNR